MHRAAAAAIALSLALLCPALRGQAAEPTQCEAREGRGILDDRYQEKLRICAWRLLEPLTRKTSGFPDPRMWTRADLVIPDVDATNRSGLRAAEELAAVRAAARTVGGATAAEPEVYEMTFFNDVARRFIEAGPHPLNRADTTQALLSKNIREIQFPAGSAALKTFWYHIPKGETVAVRVWDWAATAQSLKLDVTRLAQQCVADSVETAMKESAAGRSCVVAGASFYTIQVGSQDEFRCARSQCPSLAPGDLLILVGLHIASKQMPEWLWATWWWQGPGNSEEEAWTCGAAQRPRTVRHAGLWSNYAMNVTASFRKEKPLLARDHPCGAPAPIAGGQELRATYNPFVEAREENGLKSSCVDCHSRSSTKSANELAVPGVEETGGPLLSGFEGHVRLDYLWSIRRPLNRTPTLPRDR